MGIRNSFERLLDWQGNYIECLSRVCVILEVGYKVCIREFREFEKQKKKINVIWEFTVVMPNLNYDVSQDFEENEIMSELERTRMQIISCYLDTNNEINSSNVVKLLKVEIKTTSRKRIKDESKIRRHN